MDIDGGAYCQAEISERRGFKGAFQSDMTNAMSSRAIKLLFQYR
jgi:hypothetical protein